MQTRPKAPERPQTKTRQRDADLCITLFLRDLRMGRTKSGTNAKLHAGTDAAGRPLRMFLADCGDDADWVRGAIGKSHKIQNSLACLKGWRRVANR